MAFACLAVLAALPSGAARAAAPLAVPSRVAGPGSTLHAGAAPAQAAGAAELPEAVQAALRRACPCAGPRIGGSWPNHRQYVSCVRRTARAMARAGLIPAPEVRPAARRAAQEICGKVAPGEATARLCASEGMVVACDVLSAAHADSCAECGAALAGTLVTCSRTVDASGVERRDCASRPSAPPPGGELLEERTGVDCASCQAKLGSEIPPGVSCLAAACGQL